MTTITWVLIAAIIPFTLINGLVMVASPSSWDDLPKWLKVAGVPDPDAAFPLRRLYIRIVGAGILLCVAWVLYVLRVNYW